MKEKKLYLETFGCQMNVVDSEKIVAQLHEIGYVQTDSSAAADLILLNTCSVRDKAERKVYGHLGMFKPLKERRPEVILGVGGCVAQQEGEKMLEAVPHLDLVFGTHNVHKLTEMVQAAEEGRLRQVEVDFLDNETRLQLFPERSETDHVTAFVTIMQGCDNFCTYCIVPHVRGREISRPSAEIVAEVELLAGKGVREVTLLGQNVNSYGLSDDTTSFTDLLREVSNVDGIDRIRFMTSHPKDLSDELIDAFAELPKLCPHLHLPVQCGSTTVLEKMNRKYTRDEYLDKVDRLKTIRPDIRFTSDIIVGFPGETEDNFLETLSIVENVGYADIFTFLYSPRPGTKAADYIDDTPAAVKQNRFDRLLALQERTGQPIWQQDVGTLCSVLVEGENKRGNGQLFGRSVWNRIVNFDGDTSLIGTMIDVEITENYRNSQFGVVVKTEDVC